MNIIDSDTSRGKRATTSGFTLIEIIITIAIIGILGGIAVPAMRSMSGKGGAQRAADEMYGVIMEAKMRAVRFNQTIDIVFDMGNNRYRCEVNGVAGETVDLSKYRGRVALTNAPDGEAPATQLRFSPQGFATTSGNVFLVDPDHNTFFRLRTSYAGVTTLDRWIPSPPGKWN